MEGNEQRRQPPRYLSSELFDMVLVLGECRQNHREASRVYATRYPARRHPTAGQIHHFAETLRNTGSFYRQRVNRGGRRTPPEMIAAVRDNVTLHRHTSTRAVGRELNIHHTVAHRILKKHLGWRPWKRHTVQKLLAGDPERRMAFCDWIIDMVS